MSNTPERPAGRSHFDDGLAYAVHVRAGRTPAYVQREIDAAVRHLRDDDYLPGERPDFVRGLIAGLRDWLGYGDCPVCGTDEIRLKRDDPAYGYVWTCDECRATFCADGVLTICTICDEEIPPGTVNINGRHFPCHVKWCNEYDRTHMSDPEFAAEYYGDEA